MIRWITPQIGTAPATSSELTDDIERVDVRDLVDKSGNKHDAVRAKIEQGSALLRAGKRVVICCDYGISRSNAIASGVIAHAENISLNEAVRRVSRATGEQEIKLAPLSIVREVLEGDGGPLATTASRFVVTGGSGFLARHVRSAVTEQSDGLFIDGSQFDLTQGALDLELVLHEHGAGQILHLANPRVYTSNRAMGDMLSMLRNVLDVCRSTGAKLIFLSSWEVYSGYAADGLLASETLPGLPKGPYGEAKLLCERLIQHHREHYGLTCSIIRSSPVYGADSDKPKFLHTFLRQARDQVREIRTHRYRNGLPKLDLMHVSDLARLIAAVVEQRPVGDFNVGGGHLYSTADIAQLAIDLFGTPTELSVHDVDDWVANVRLDSTRARQMLGWSPQKRLEDYIAALAAAPDRLK